MLELSRYRVEWGAVVAIRPRTGEILAMAEYAHERPDLSRLALNANAPAASVFKIISAAALLEYAQLRPEDPICTHGGHQKLTLYNLEPNERLALWLRAEEEMSVAELTRVLGLENATGARALLQTARRKLRAALDGGERERRP